MPHPRMRRKGLLEIIVVHGELLFVEKYLNRARKSENQEEEKPKAEKVDNEKEGEGQDRRERRRRPRTRRPKGKLLEKLFF